MRAEGVKTRLTVDVRLDVPAGGFDQPDLRPAGASVVGAAPAARPEPGALRRLRPWVSAIVANLRGGGPPVSLPLDIQATAFQRRVWEALQQIPYGETRSYGDVARAVGAPSATRAVANACAANPVALVIPCHRVIRADGEVGGYRWGTERKRALLRLEREGRRPPDSLRAAPRA